MGKRIKDIFKLFKSFLLRSFQVKVGYDVCVTIVYTNVLHYVHCKKTLSQNRTLLDSISRSEEILIVILFLSAKVSFSQECYCTLSVLRMQLQQVISYKILVYLGLRGEHKYKT